MYNYNDIKPCLFIEEGQRSFLEVRDKTQALLKQAGSVRINEVLMRICGESWTVLASFDRMVELGEIRELTDSRKVPGQHRVFVSNR